MSFKLRLFQIWVVVVAWFFGAWPPELRLLPHRRWLVAFAFRMRWSGYASVANGAWWLARLWSQKSTQPALAAFSARYIMNGIMQGTER